jgi:hypothetical protein
VLQRLPTDQPLPQGGRLLLGEALVVHPQRRLLARPGGQQVPGGPDGMRGLGGDPGQNGGDVLGRHQVGGHRLELLEPLGDRVQLVAQVGLLGLGPPAPPVTRPPAEPVQAGRRPPDLARLVVDGGRRQPEHLGDQRQQPLGVLAVQRIRGEALMEAVADQGVPVADLQRLHRAVGREPRVGLGHVAQHLLGRPEGPQQDQQREGDAGPEHELPDPPDRSWVAQHLHGRTEQPELLLVARPAVLVEQLGGAAGLPGPLQQRGHRLVAAVLADVQHDHPGGDTRGVPSWLAHVRYLGRRSLGACYRRRGRPVVP